MSARTGATLAVLGGSSPATPGLIQALRTAQRNERLGPLQLRLYGRNVIQLQRICEYAAFVTTKSHPHATHEPALQLVPCVSIATALAGATHILCMVRPGGMRGRADDEALALSCGVPADEGLAAGGLRCFLRGRALIGALAEHCARHAPNAHLLQMTSPLGLNVAITRRAFGERAFGVCELPLTTARKVAHSAEQQGHMCWSSHSHAGLNHQSWLYAFRDARGRDVTGRVLNAITSESLLGVAPTKIRECGAVPVHYLRMYLHTRRVLNAQRAAMLRGRALTAWSRRVNRALCAAHAPKPRMVERLLAERTMDWFRDGVVPVLEALLGPDPVDFTLNVPAAGVMDAVPDQCIVEVDCRVSAAGVRPQRVPPLPERPAALTRKLLVYEQAVLALSGAPTSRQLARVLELHPLTPRKQIHRLARSLFNVASESAELT